MSVLMVKRLRTSIFRPRFPGGAETEEKEKEYVKNCQMVPGRFYTIRD